MIHTISPSQLQEAAKYILLTGKDYEIAPRIKTTILIMLDDFHYTRIFLN